MEVDKSLVMKSEQLQQLVDTLLESLEECPKDLLDTSPHPTNQILVKFADLIYTPKTSGESDAKYGTRILSGSTLLDGWRLLITATNTATLNGYFGAAFAHTGSQQVVVAHRGTDPKNIGALYTDLKGIFGTKYTSCMNSATTFVDQIGKIINLANKKHRNYTLAITGHSLGAWLAQITTFSVKYLAISNSLLQKNSVVGLHAKTVGFDSPGARDMLDQVLDDYFDRYAMNVFLDGLDITLYLSAPNRINTCGVHLGRIYQIYIDVSKLSSIEYNVSTHAMSNFVAAFKDKNGPIGEVLDWAKNAKEYEKVFEKHADEHEFLMEKIHRCNVVELKSTENAEFRVFSEDELQILYKLHELQEQKSTQNILVEFVERKLKVDISYLFPYFELDHDSRTIKCKFGESLSELCNRLKQLMRWLKPEFTQAVEKQIKVFPYAADFIYYAEGQSYLDSLPKCCLDFEDHVDFQDFLESGTERVLWIVTNTGDTAFQMTRLRNIFHQIQKSVNSSDSIFKYFSESNYTFMRWPQMQKLYPTYGWPIEKEYLMVVDNTSSSITLEERTTLINHVHSKSMKLILFTSQPVDIPNTFELIKTINSDVQLTDLTLESQEKIFQRDNVIMFGGEGFSFQQFLGDDCSLDDVNLILSSECLKKFATIENYAINLMDTRPTLGDLQMPFFKLNIKTSKEFIFSCVESPNANILVVMSGLSREELETEDGWKQLKGKEIILTEGDADLSFKVACNLNQQKRIFLLDVFGGEVYCKQIFNRGFNLPRRFLHLARLDMRTLAKTTSYSNNLFVISSEEDKISLLELIENCKDRQAFTEYVKIAMTKEEERDVIQKNFNKNIHFVNIGQREESLELVIEWRYSHGSVESLRPFVSMNSCDELTLSQTDRNFVIITDEPGMGKTTSLGCLSRRIESAWVIFVELKNFQSHVERISGELTAHNVATFLLSKCCTPADGSPAHGLLKHLLQSETCSKKVVLMFDGFDELDDYDKDKESAKKKIIRLLVFLKTKQSVQIFLTVRNYLRESLEQKFSIFSTCFEELGTEEKLDFLVKFWQSCLSLNLGDPRDKQTGPIRVYANELLRETKRVLGPDMDCFVGVPLQLRMLAEVFRPQSQLLDQPQNFHEHFDIISVPKLYKRFITQKYEIYINEKTQLGKVGDKLLEEDILNYVALIHGELGFRAFFSNFYNKFLIHISDVHLDAMNRFGLVHSTANGKFQFIHRTYAEYFCAQMVVQWLNQRDSLFRYHLIKEIILPQILMHPDNRTIRTFMNAELNEITMKNTALEINVKYIGQILLEDNATFRNKEHQTSLHIAIQEKNEQIVALLLSGMKKESTQEAFAFFITQYDDKNNTALHLMNDPTYRRTDDSFLNTIMENILEGFKSCSYETIEKILFACLFNRDTSYVSEYLIKSGNVRAKTSPEFKKIRTRVKEVESVVGRYTKFLKQNNVKQVKIILSKRLNNNVERYCLLVGKQKKSEAKSSLHLAAKLGHIEIVQFLAEILTPVPFAILMARPDEHKKTALHAAAEYGHLNIVRYLVECGSDINSRSKRGQSALMCAAQNYEQLMLCYVKVGSESIVKFDCSVNEPHTYIEHRKLSIVKYLVERGANTNFADARGLTALQKAADTDHFLIVKYLIDGGADISLNDIINEDGETALHKAAQRGRHLSVEYLLQKGADPDKLDRRGWTALSWASLQEAWDVVRVLLDGGADVNADGGQAFCFAIWWKEWSVVKSFVDKGASVLESKITFDLSEFKNKIPNYENVLC